MPMKRENYPLDWNKISRSRKEAAGWQCEATYHPLDIPWLPEIRCSARHGDIRISAKGKLYKVVLTTAHLDHNPQNCAPENLKVYCQLHHLRYDHAMHVAHAKETRARKKRQNQQELWEA